MGTYLMNLTDRIIFQYTSFQIATCWKQLKSTNTTIGIEKNETIMRRAKRIKDRQPISKGDVITESIISRLKYELILSVYLEQGNLRELKHRFSQQQRGPLIESLIYILETESLIKFVNKEYIATSKGTQTLKEKSMI